jgi:hypothetical protein
MMCLATNSFAACFIACCSGLKMRIVSQLSSEIRPAVQGEYLSVVQNFLSLASDSYHATGTCRKLIKAITRN